MADDKDEIVLTWLNDAYRIEHALAHVLERHAKEAKNQPEIEAKIGDHLTQTRHHATLVARRISALGGEPSAPKEALAGVLAPMQTLLTGAAEEESLLKNSIADFAAEHFEIATYRAIITAAQDSGDAETAQVCRQILGDEQEMARWLDEHMPSLVDQIISAAVPQPG